jgi:hypothetical protein
VVLESFASCAPFLILSLLRPTFICDFAVIREAEGSKGRWCRKGGTLSCRAAGERGAGKKSVMRVQGEPKAGSRFRSGNEMRGGRFAAYWRDEHQAAFLAFGTGFMSFFAQA